MRCIFIILAVGMVVLGCARDPLSPPSVSGDAAVSAPALVGRSNTADGPYRLWGEWDLFIDAEHERVDVIPRRDMHMHLNALKFLEQYCKDCLQITSIRNNGDSTIDLTVRITHPFNGFPEYTGFDVKGIIMFNGSYEYENPGKKDFDLPQPFFRISWREMGDPELLNPDGYTPRWSPSWDSGSNLPIFNYWRGKYSSGTPNADLNAFLNFYSDEARHMFGCYATVERTYTIWLPPGPLVAAYAVEACWEPPTVTPVTNPIEDFPLTANQPEAYHFKWILNNGQVVTDCEECCGPFWLGDCSTLYIEHAKWGECADWERVSVVWPDGGGMEDCLRDCEPPQEGRFTWYGGGFGACHYGNGMHRFVALNYWFDWPPGVEDIAYTVFDMTVNDPDLDD